MSSTSVIVRSSSWLVTEISLTAATASLVEAHVVGDHLLLLAARRLDGRGGGNAGPPTISESAR